MRCKKTQTISIFGMLLLMIFFSIITFQNTVSVEGAEFTFKQFKIELEYGLNGTVKDDCDTPLSIRITNTGDDFEGKLHITNNENVAYEFELKLAKGESQSFDMITRYFYNNNGLKLKILDLSGKIIVRENINTNYNQDIYNIGLLSNDNSSLKHFKSIVIEKVVKYRSFTSSIVELDKEDISTSSSALSCLTFLVINSFDTSQLSAEQCQAIQKWVLNGGILIIGTGADASTTLSAFADETKFDKDFLNVTVNGAIKGDVTVLIDKEKGSTQTTSFVKEDNVQSISIEGGQISNTGSFEDSYFTYDDELSLVQKKEIGKGAILVTGFNLSSDPIGSLKWKKRVAGAVLSDSITDAAIESIYSYYLEDNLTYWEIQDVLRTFFDKKQPNLILYVLLFILFVLGIGPVGYLILKKRNKTHWMWGLIPIGTVCFTMLLYILSISNGIHKPTTSNFTILEVNDNNTATKTTHMALKLPYLGEYEIQFQPEYGRTFEVTGWDETYGITMFVPTLKDWYEKLFDVTLTYDTKIASNFYIKDTETGCTWTVDNINRFATNFFKFYTDNDIENCSFDIQITEATTTQFAGSVTNHTGYDIIESFICYGGLAIYIGDFADGETKTFTADDCLLLPEFSSDILSRYIKTSDAALKEKIQAAYGAISKASTYSVVHPIIPNDLEYDEGIVFGYISDFEEDIIVNTEIKENGVGVIYKRFRLQPSDMDSEYIDNLFVFAENIYTEDISYSTYLMASSTAEVECMVMMDNISKMIKSDTSPFGDKSAEMIIWAFNYETNQYEQLFRDSNEIIFTDSCPYMNENARETGHNMQLRLECVYYSQDGKYYAPKISLIGE